MCSRTYPACNTHVQYCRLWPVRLNHILSTLSHKWHNFIENKICGFIFSTTLVWNTYSKKIWVRYDNKFTWVLMLSTRYSCPILTKLEFFLQFSEKSSNIKYHENLSSCSMRREGTDLTKLIVTFRNFAKDIKQQTCLFYIRSQCLPWAG